MSKISIAPDFGKEWIGVDLDGTLAYYSVFQEGAIGKPIPLMLSRVKAWLRAGKRVKILTARACTNDPQVIKDIQDWTQLWLGQRLEVTAMKDWMMVEFWDDRCIQVMPNTGVTVSEYIKNKKQKVK